jgi:flagellar basal body L-ring protein FlgH
MPAGKGTYGTKKGRPPKAKMPRQGKGSKPNPFSAGASTTKKKAMPTANKKTAGKQKLAAMYGDPKTVTRGDIITAAKMNKKKKKG